MTRDRSRRVSRCYLWGFGAALAAAAGAAAQQNQQDQQRDQGMQQQNQATQQGQQDQQSWRPADRIQQLSNVDLAVLSKEENNRTTQITVQNGRVVSAEIDGQYTSPDKVQVQGNRIRVLDENNQVAATFRVPRVSGLAGMDRRFGTTEQYDDRVRSDQYFDRPQQDRFRDQQFQDQQYRDQRFQDQRFQDQRFRDRDMTDDRYYRDTMRHQDDWRLRQQQGRSDQDDWREQDLHRGARQQDYYRDSYRQDRYDPRYDRQYDRGSDRRFDDRRGMQEQDRFYDDRGTADRQRSGRIYGTPEAGRAPMALGIMTSEATQTDLNVTGGTTTYTQGIKIDRVHEDMPAATAGLQKGDVIVSIDGRTPATMTVLRQRLQEKEPGDTLRLRVIRNGAERDVNVRVEEVDSSKYNWDFVDQNARTVDHGLNTLRDQEMLQQPNRQEIYRPSQDASGNAGRPLFDRMRDNVNPRR